ncbi:AAEL010461-PA [Aedes aegypti]|uniref:Peroxisomal membrane protein PEX16 n=2 Tax=Aedes aegypti TaxID=7159 RepID=Q16SW3_AEDAE|nr:AAEL010461-PA [Aedes aegypti]
MKSSSQVSSRNHWEQPDKPGGGSESVWSSTPLNPVQVNRGSNLANIGEGTRRRASYDHRLDGFEAIGGSRLVQEASDYPEGRNYPLGRAASENCTRSRGCRQFSSKIKSVCIGRVILTMFCQNNNIIQNPPIPVLDRKNLVETARPDNSTFQELTDTVVLKRSGRVLRKVEGAPPIVARTFKPLKHEPVVIRYGGRFIRTAELMYILKPLVHLACVRRYGFKSWKSYLVPMAIDVASLRIYYKNREDLSKEQKQELSRRCVSMLLYLMRSPFYDKYSKQRIASLLTGIGNKVPLTGTITNLILSYIPHWQETYFYMWST